MNTGRPWLEALKESRGRRGEEQEPQSVISTDAPGDHRAKRAKASIPQTTPQILRSLSLGRYTARVVDGELSIQGPQPLAGPLPASIKARLDELAAVLNEHCGGAWPPALGSDFYRELVREEPPKKPLKEPLTVEEKQEEEEF